MKADLFEACTILCLHSFGSVKRREEIEVLDVSCAHIENTVSWLDSLCRWSQRECIVKHLLCIASNILISGICGKDIENITDVPNILALKRIIFQRKVILLSHNGNSK